MMKIPPEITYRDVDKTAALDNLIAEKIAKLERFCPSLNSCRIAVEKIHDRPSHGSPYRVRIDMTLPPGQEIAVVRNPEESDQYAPIEAIIRSAFDAAIRQGREFIDKQRQDIKVHPQQEMAAVVTKLFPEQGYGFIKTLDDGREIYFHENSVANDDFERIKVGTGVNFSETDGVMGPQATTVHIVNKPGVSAGNTQEEEIEPPLGWQKK